MFAIEHFRRPLQQQGFPLRDLVGMNIKVLRQLSYSLLFFKSCQSHFSFEAGRVDPARSLCHVDTPDYRMLQAGDRQPVVVTGCSTVRGRFPR
jgi:hypothetical protein